MVQGLERRAHVVRHVEERRLSDSAMLLVRALDVTVQHGVTGEMRAFQRRDQHVAVQPGTGRVRSPTCPRPSGRCSASDGLAGLRPLALHVQVTVHPAVARVRAR